MPQCSAGRLFVVISAVSMLSNMAFCTAGDIDTVAGTGRPTNNGASGSAASFNVAQPFGVEFGPDSALYITEVGNHRVLRLDLKRGTIRTIAGTGKKGYSGDGGPATQAALNEPYEVRFDKQGNMYFVEMQNFVIRRVDAKTGRISTVAGTGKRGYAGDGEPAINAKFSVPHSIALDDAGGLYVADIGNHRIRRIDLKTGIIATIAGTGEKILPKDGTQARGNPILGPRALYIRQGHMWIALREGNSIWKLSLNSGVIRHVAGTGKAGYGGDGGTALAATFRGPKGIAVDPRGNVFVVDSENHVIRKIDVDRQIVTTIAGAGPQAKGYSGDGGPATRAGLSQPHGICVTANGTVFLGDTRNHRVRRILP